MATAAATAAARDNQYVTRREFELERRERALAQREIRAYCEGIETRLDARLQTVETKMEAGFAAHDQRLGKLEHELIDVKRSIDGLKTTVVVTAISSCLALAAINTTVLSNMVVSFDSGRETAASIERAVMEMKALRAQGIAP